MATLTQASRQWATRPDDERFLSLPDMYAHFREIYLRSSERVVASRSLAAIPEEDHKGLVIRGPGDVQYIPTHWAFGQLAKLADAPVSYLRNLPSDLAADCINWGIHVSRDVEDVGVLFEQNGSNYIRAATGPRYGRIWNHEIVSGLMSRFGDGVTGNFRVPGEFGKRVQVTKENTTLYAGDRDMFVFLADEDHRIEIPNRRNGEPGSLARGFFVWNSEVGSATFGIGTFLFDYVCCNRIVWGAQEYKEIRIRHTPSAPERWADEMVPMIHAYANSSARSVTEAIEASREKRLEDKTAEFLANRFGKRMVPVLQRIHEAEEGRPIETLWDATVAATAYARTLPNAGERVEMERTAGDILTLAA